MNGLICDNCQTVLALDSRNGREDTNGELAAWVTVEAGGLRLNACTRSCARELLDDDGPLRSVIDAHLAAIAEVAATIRDDLGDDQP